MNVLGIESTCDETACAVVRDGKEILSNIIASQIPLHALYGGVVPELACREHVDQMIPVLDKALKASGLSLQEIDLIAVASSPGLIGALLIGINTAKALSLATGIPFIGINHIEAHLYAALMSHEDPPFPCLGVVLSGGHTALLEIEEIGSYTVLGQTVDDAIGEAFDKVAKMLNLPYPGGPEIEKLAKQGDPHRYPFKAGQVKKNPLAFSFSGLKTNVLYAIKGQDLSEKERPPLSLQEKRDIAASFQHAAFEDVQKKVFLAAQNSHCQTILFGGGVTNSQTLRARFAAAKQPYALLWPKPELSLDNAAMIAGLGYHHYLQRKEGDSLDLQASPQNIF